MVAMDLDAFRGHLLQMTDLLAVETSALIESRPRFAHAVLVLAERGALPGERLKANYIKQLDPHWVETTKVNVSKADSSVKRESGDDSATTAPCLLCRQHGHRETSHFKQQVHREHFETLRHDVSPATCSPSGGVRAPQIDGHSPSGKRDENNNNSGQPLPAGERQLTLSPIRRPVIAPSNLSCIAEVLTPPPSKLQSPVRAQSSEEIEFIDQQHTPATVPDKPWFAAREAYGPELPSSKTTMDQSAIKSSQKTTFDSNIRSTRAADDQGYENGKSSATVRSPSSTGNERFTERYELHEKWTNRFPSTAIDPNRRTDQPRPHLTSGETNEEFVKRIYQRKLLNYGAFPSEERERYARWRAANPPPIDAFESRTDKIKISPPPLNFPTQSRTDEPRPDPLINEAIRILEASCHMLDETTRQLNRQSDDQMAHRSLYEDFQSSIRSEEAFSRNRHQTTSLRYPREYNRSRSNGTVAQPHHYRYRSYDRPSASSIVRPSYEDAGGLTTKTVTTKFRHEKIVETTRQQ